MPAELYSKLDAWEGLSDLYSYLVPVLLLLMVPYSHEPLSVNVMDKGFVEACKEIGPDEECWARTMHIAHDKYDNIHDLFEDIVSKSLGTTYFGQKFDVDLKVHKNFPHVTQKPVYPNADPEEVEDLKRCLVAL